MQSHFPNLKVKLAATEQEVRAAQRLRYMVFVTELGGGGALVNHEEGLEIDQFDPFYDHLILVNTDKAVSSDKHVVGVYRLLRGNHVQTSNAFYSEDEYDLSVLKKSGRKLLELGRSCVHVDHRGGVAMHLLWQGLSRYIIENEIEILFGVASFHGTDASALAQPLSLLHQNFLAPQDLRVRAKNDHFQTMDQISAQELDRPRAMIELPSLIKSYLRLGGFVGEGAYVDHAFNTTDICLILDVERMTERQKNSYIQRAVA